MAHIEVKVFDDRFGLRGYATFKKGSVFFEPAAAHKSMIGSIVGRLSESQKRDAKTAFAEKAGIAVPDIL